MKKNIKKIISALMVVVMCLTMAPLQSFVGFDMLGWFASEAKAALLSDLDFFEEDYIASIILNTNTESCAISDDGKSVASMTLDYYTQPKNISISKCFTDALEGDAEFMSSVAAWEVLTFEPTDIYSEAMTKQGYYQTILFNILEVAVDYNIIPTIVKNMNNHVISTLKAINELEIKVDDVVVSGETTWDLLNADHQHQIIQKTAGRMTELEMRNQSFSDFAMLVKTCTTVTDFVEKAAQLTALTTLTEDVKAVIDELYANSSFVNNMELKTAILELKTAMNSKIDSIGTIGLEMLCSTGKLSMDIFLSQMWAEAVTSLLGSLGAGLLIGQVIGRGLSNILFSTDKVIEQFYTMQALSDVEVLMCKTVKSLGQKYIASQNTTNASNFLKAIDLLYNTYKLDFEYTADFAEIIYTKGLINKVNLFVSGTPDSLEEINSIVSSVNFSLNSSLGMITDIDNYCWYLETDFPEVFAVYYGGMSDEEIMNKYIDEVRQLTVACPTDVDIYDAEGNLAVSVKNNLVESCLPGYVCVVEEDVKYILLNADNQSSIRITGTADGTMNYTICEGDKTGFKRTMIFKDIILTEGCTYEAKLPEKTRLRSEEYSLTSNIGEIIKPSYDTQPDIEDNIVDVVVAEELFDGFPVEIIDLVADTMFNMKSVVDLSAYDISTDDAVALFSAVAKYYPAEYSLIANSDFTYKIIVSPNLDRIMKIRFYYGDDASLDTYQKRVKDLNAEIDALVAKVEGMDEFEKALNIHDYIVLNSEYDLELLEYMEKNNFILPGELRSEKYTEYSILVNGTGVCGSYALAYRAVLNAAGMECLYLSSSQMNHAWNLVKIDGKWYHVDCCWDDPTPDTYGRARRTYFLRTDDEIMNLNHYSWTPGQYKANSEKYSIMPRNYDIKQKYDDGKWYYLTGSTLYSSDEYGKNETEITSISASSIDADNGNVYYSNGRYIYEYDIENDERNLVYMLSNSDSGDNPSQASLSNIYVSGECVEFYKSVHKDDKRITVYDTDILQREKFGAVTGITLASTEETANVFEKIYLNATVEKTEGIIEDYEIVWDSSNVNVASVDENGMVLCGNIGTTTITASVGSFKTECSIKVNGDGLSGMCGDNTKWSFDTMTKIFTISGNGDTYDHFDKPWYKFSNEIKYVNIEENVTSVGDMFFEGCNNLISVNIANTVKYIGQCAFSYCPKIEKIVVPDSVTHIRGNAFASCKNLKYLVFGSGLKDIDIGNALNGLENLISIEVSENNDNFMSDEYGVMYSKDQSVLYKYPAKSSLEKYVVSKHTKEINFDAFSYCTELKYIDLPEGLTEISYAFYHCYSLEYIKIPDTVTTIGSAAFGMCTNLKNVQLPKNLQVISSHAFLWCENLKRVFIPDTTKRIEGSAFSSCGIEEVVIPESVKYLGSQFSDTPAFSSIRILVKGKDLSWTRFSTNSIVYGYSNTIVEEYTTEKGIVFIAIDTDNHIHDYFLMDYVEPNKEQDGYEYYECYCGEASYTTTLHCYGEESTTAPTCILEGSKTQTCLNCGEVNALETTPATGKHDYKLVSTVPGNCTTAPVYTYECSVCHNSYTKEGRIDDGHNYVETVVEPTCSEKGYTKEICTVCGETLLSDFTSPKGHEFVITRSEDYCEAHGTLEYSCKKCDYYEKIASDGTNLVTETVTVEPTCTKSGSKTEICTLCKATISTEILNPLSHDYAEEFTVDKAATCTAEGSKSQHCTRCDAKRAITVIEATGHQNTSIINTAEATCAKNGYTGDTFCSDCSSIIANGALTDKLSHTESDWITDKATTCTSEGSKHIECTECSEVIKTEVIAKLSHEYTSVVTKPSCENGGYTTFTCSNCSDSYVSDKTPATGHNYVDGVCTACGESKIDNCSHMCHKSGFMGFIWKIVRFFFKLFKIQPVCSCGVAHY